MARFIIVLHEAKRAGKHWDLRFEIPNSKNWASFAFKKTAPDLVHGNQKIGISRTHDHSEKEALFIGTIESGYGAGVLKKYDSGTCEVLKFSSNSIKVDFEGSKLKGIYNFVKIKSFDKTANPNRFLFFKGKEIKESIDMKDKDILKIIEQYTNPDAGSDVPTGKPNEENELEVGKEPADLEGGDLKDDIIDELTEELLNSDEFSYLSEEEKKWIQGAIKHPGALHRALGVKQGEKIPAKKLKVKASDSPKLKRMKILAKTLKKMRKK